MATGPRSVRILRHIFTIDLLSLPSLCEETRTPFSHHVCLTKFLSNASKKKASRTGNLKILQSFSMPVVHLKIVQKIYVLLCISTSPFSIYINYRRTSKEFLTRRAPSCTPAIEMSSPFGHWADSRASSRVSHADKSIIRRKLQQLSPLANEHINNY